MKCLLAMLLSCVVDAADIPFGWEPSPSSPSNNVIGYSLFTLNTASNVWHYAASFESTNGVLRDFPTGIHVIGAKAENDAGLRSDTFSNLVTASVLTVTIVLERGTNPVAGTWTAVSATTNTIVATNNTFFRTRLTIRL